MSTHYRGDAFLSVKGASGGRGSVAERLVFVFQCYLDDSGTSGLPIVTMAGFLGAMKHWESLEPKLNAIMDSYGVDVFHAKPFQDTKSPFENWKKVKKHSFAEELFAATHGCIHGLSMTIRKADFVKGQRETGKHVNMSPIGVCFSAIMTRILTDAQIAPALKQDGLAFLIESGNKNNPGIEKFFHQMSKEPTFEGCLRSLTFVSKDSCRAIQLADFFAFYSRREMRNHDRFSGKLALPACPFLQIMERHGPIWQRASYGFPDGEAGRLESLPDLNSLQALTVKRPS
jgi:hypothetical protein